MRGTINWQVQELYKEVAAIGESKHSAKTEARSGGAATWHDVGQKLGVHSYSTADEYRAVWRHVAEHARTESGIKNMEKLTGEHVKSYLESKISDGVAAATFASYASACEKLSVALDRYAVTHETGKVYGFSKSISEARAQAAGLEKFEGSRAYEKPAALVAAITDEQFKLAATLQYEGGARMHEISQIKESQLKGLRMDAVTGQQRGFIEVRGKGGKIREILVSPGAYNRLSGEIKSNADQQFKINENIYGKAITVGALASGQKAEGTHGLRWSYACLLYTSPSPRDGLLSRMPSSA